GQLRSALVFALQEIAQSPQSRKVFEIVFLKCELVEVTDTLWVRRQEAARRAHANFERILHNAVVRGQLAEDLDIPLACAAMRAMMGGLISNWVFMPGQFELAKEAGRLVDGCLDMVRYAGSLRG
ncbi:MAG: TetR family transcriptional regulator, partial [Herminiimonas sp.]|nr:TetR family transcriptional regulator [Herminiimonas sp.]